MDIDSNVKNLRNIAIEFGEESKNRGSLKKSRHCLEKS